MTLQVQFSMTLVDEWCKAGVRHAVVAPGSRSSTIALALLGDERMTVHVRLDERSAGFFALGAALASGEPVVMVTTSGTAAAEVHAAVLEADLARVPLIVCTADRPPELHGVGAPQTVEQVGLFAGAVRFAVDAGVPDAATRPHWRSFASRLVAEATAGPKGPGPVHANLAFREPLVGEAGPLPDDRGVLTWHRVVRGPATSAPAIAAFAGRLGGAVRGCFVVGGGLIPDATAITTLADRLSWPVLSDGRAICREPAGVVVSHADQILRSPAAAEALSPDLVVHVGAPHASKVVSRWCEALAQRGVVHLLIDPFGSFEDPERYAELVIAADPGALCREALSSVDQRRDGAAPAWMAAWRSVDDAVEVALGDALDATNAVTEPGIARRLVDALPPRSTLVCSSSMPVRDVEWFAGPRSAAPVVLANRGANGIDGVVSTILGVAAVGGAGARVPDPSPGAVVGLLGDLAFLHDLSGLVWGRLEQVPAATLVVVDNAGGGIFSFLDYAGRLAPEVFERGFGTPQAASVAAVARALGCRVVEVAGLDAMVDALAAAVGTPGISVIVVLSDREANPGEHDSLTRAVTAAVEDALGTIATS